MKIGDIISKKEQSIGKENTGKSEAEKLKQQREEIEKELRQQVMENEQSQQPVQSQPPQQIQEEEEDDIPELESDSGKIEFPEQQPRFEDFVDQKNPERTKYKISVFLENGQKLPIVFEAYDNELEIIMKDLDLAIEAKRVVSMGSFRFPGDKVLYIDMLGR